MPLSEMGSAPALLSVANQAAGEQQRGKIEEQQLNQKALDDSSQSLIKGKELENQFVTITPQLAEGAAKMTGDDSWKRTVGTKMDGRIYSALLTAGAQKSYHENLLNNHELLEQMREESKSRDLEKKSKAQSDLEDKKEGGRTDRDDQKHKYKITEIDEAGKFKGKGGGKGPSEDPKDKEFLKTYRGYSNDLKGFNSTLLSQMAKSDPTKAKELQDKQIFLQKNKGRFDQLQGMSPDAQPKPEEQAGQNSKAIDWLKSNYPKLTNPTDHDIQWALDQMNKKK